MPTTSIPVRYMQIDDQAPKGLVKPQRFQSRSTGVPGQWSPEVHRNYYAESARRVHTGSLVTPPGGTACEVDSNRCTMDESDGL